MGPDQLGAAHFHTASKPLKEIDIRLPENLVKVNTIYSYSMFYELYVNYSYIPEMVSSFFFLFSFD